MHMVRYLCSFGAHQAGDVTSITSPERLADLVRRRVVVDLGESPEPVAAEIPGGVAPARLLARLGLAPTAPAAVEGPRRGRPRKDAIGAED